MLSICSELNQRAPECGHGSRSGVFTVNFEQIQQILT